MRGAIVVAMLAAVVGTAREASAGPLADAIARHADADLVALRARLAEVDARCALGAAYARRRDLPRAALFLAGCDDAELGDDAGATIRAIARETKKQLAASDLAMIELVSQPAGLVATIDALPGESITLPATLWLPPGIYLAHAVVDGAVLENRIEARARSRGSTMFAAPPARPRDPHGPATVDFRDEPGGEAPGERTVAPPPDQKHPSLMSDKYRGITTASGPPIDDPLALAGDDGAPAHPGWALGARLGAGVFDDGAGAARAGAEVAAVGRVALGGPWFVAPRVDWSRRGSHAIDELGATAAAGLVVVKTRELAIGVAAGARVDLRLASRVDGMTVGRVGVGGTLAIEAAIGSLLAVGIHAERSVTPLAGARDSAVVLEVGLDWR